MKQLRDDSKVLTASGHRGRVHSSRASISSRSLVFKVSATAEAASALASAVETTVQSPVQASTVRVDAPVTKRVYFEVCREVAVGEDVRVVGDHEELGAWDASQGLALQWHPGHVWKGSVAIPADAQFSYKLVQAGADGVCIEWEEGDDRSLDLQELPSDGISASVVWGQPAQYSSCVPYIQNEPAANDVHGDEDVPPTSELSSEAQSSYTARIAIQKELCLGQHLKLVGNSPVLGEWDFRAAPAFTWSPEHVWQLELQLPVGEPVDWKIVQAVESNNEWCEWQSGENTIIDPSALKLSSGDVLEVGCSWDGPSRATIVETAGLAPAGNSAAQPELIKVTEEPVYGSDGTLDDSDASTAASTAIASVAHSVTTSPAPQAAIDEQDATKQQVKADKVAQKPRGFDLSMSEWGGMAPAAAPTPEPTSPSQSEPPTPTESEAAPTEKSDTSSPAEVPTAEKLLAVSPWDSLPSQDPAPAAAQTATLAAEAEAALSPPAGQDSKPAPEAEPAAAPAAAQDTTKEAATSKDLQTAEDALKELQASGTGLEDMVLSPEQLSKLAEAGLDGTKVTIAGQDDVTFELQRGRLGKDDEGSTVIVRGGMNYNSETGTVTVNSPLGTGPDGILVDKDGKTVEEAKGAAGSTQEPAVKLISPENIADVKPEDEVGVLTKVGAYAGMAAAGLGAATLMGGLAVDFADVALVAGLYGVATAIGTSRSGAIRSKGAAGPVLSALVTASDIAKRMKGPASSTADAKSATSKDAVKPVIGKYEKSETADVSKPGSVPIPTNEEIAAMQAEQAIVKKAGVRAVEMQAQLGDNGMHALEDGVNQVMSTDVQRILKALDSSLSDEEKVIHLVKMLLNGQPAACKTEESLKVEVRAAMRLAQEHVSAVQQSDKKAQHAPPVLLAALAMSAVDEMRGVKTV